MCEYQNFRLDKLFISQNGDFDIQQKHINGKAHWVVSSGETNLGIIGKSDVKAKVFSSGTITIDMFGYPNYRGYEYKMVTHARVFSLSLITGEKLTREVGMYFVAQFLYFKKIFSYDNMASWDKIKNLEISLPITASGEISLAYIESYIRELEAARIRELEAYLKVTGLSDYKLSDNDLQFISDYYEGGARYKPFRIDKIFDIFTGRDVIISRTTEGSIPLISHRHDNNGISKIIVKLNDRKLFNYKETIALADRGVFWASTQNQDFHIGTRVKALVFKDGEKSEEIRLFLATAINKLQILFKEYLTNATDSLPDLEIQLPADQDGNPDYEYMTRFIRIQKKLAIKNVIEWKDKELAVYKKVASN